MDPQLTEQVLHDSVGNPLALVELSTAGRRDVTPGPYSPVVSRFLDEVSEFAAA